jgi:RNA polymerase sigma-70 factor (ECF subfamily)
MTEKEFNIHVVPLSRFIFLLCYRILGNRTNAKDAVQEVFIKLWNDRDKLKEIRSIEAYARTIARNHCLDKLRIQKQNVGVEEINKFELLYDDEKECVSNTVERVNLVKIAATKLSSVQQRVFTMRDIEGFDYDEIAHELGLSNENVRVILSRARKSIREMVLKIQKMQQV